jgi:hypothetical protein
MEGVAMGADSDRNESRQRLATLVRQQVADSECWARAETCLRADALRARLDDIAVPASADIAAALMAAAMLLASSSNEWGGDYRDALCDLAALGLELFDH